MHLILDKEHGCSPLAGRVPFRVEGRNPVASGRVINWHYNPKPLCIENIEVMWYVDEKGGINAVKHEKN
jgi:hypothetical protein